MDKYKPEENEFIGVIKRQTNNFIARCQSLDNDQKQALLKELGSNWYDDRFSGKEFIEDATLSSNLEWQNRNFERVQLWKDIAVSNAKVNNEPFDVADKTIEAFNKSFNLDK